MKRTLIKFISFTILIGVIALCINVALGKDTIMFLTKETIVYNHSFKWYMWKFDFWKYLTNLQLSTSNLSVLVFKTPTRAWQNNMDWNALGNNLLVILDYLIMVINIILYPIKIGAYLLQNLLAILGVNTDVNNTNNGLGWLVSFVQDILGNFAIPYL